MTPILDGILQNAITQQIFQIATLDQANSSRVESVVREADCGLVLCRGDSNHVSVLADQNHQLLVLESSHIEQLLDGLDVEVIELGVLNESRTLSVYIAAKEILIPESSGIGWAAPRPVLIAGTEVGFDLLSRALQLSHWANDHKFCGRCGTELKLQNAPMAMRCIPCEREYYPRLSPCIITLVTRGDECLLASHTQRPDFFTTLAGFIEAGESAEDCVRREVREEVGIEVGKLSYLASQSWPFPGQLMLAWRAEYKSGEIQVDPEEILEAHWYRYDELPTIPAEFSIAGRMIRDFVAERTALASDSE